MQTLKFVMDHEIVTVADSLLHLINVASSAGVFWTRQCTFSY